MDLNLRLPPKMEHNRISFKHNNTTGRILKLMFDFVASYKIPLSLKEFSKIVSFTAANTN